MDRVAGTREGGFVLDKGLDAIENRLPVPTYVWANAHGFDQAKARTERRSATQQGHFRAHRIPESFQTHAQDLRSRHGGIVVFTG